MIEGKLIHYFVPAYRSAATIQCAMSIASDVAVLKSMGARVALGYASMFDICRARNHAVRAAYDAGADFLVMRDSDVSSQSDAMFAMFKTFVDWSHEKIGMVAAAVATRGKKINCEPVKIGNSWTVDKCGTGLVILNLLILAEIPRPWFAHSIADNGIDLIAGEDVKFVQGMNDCGIKTIVRGDITTGHMCEDEIIFRPASE